MFSLMRGSIPDAGSDPLAVIRKAAALGAGEVTFYSLFELSPTLDAAVLAELKAEADQLGIRIAASLDWLNPLRLDRQTREIALGDGDFARGVGRLLEAGAFLGMSEMFFTIGTLDDRAGNWDEQLAAVAAFLIALKPKLRKLGMRLLVKTHEEITSFETLALIEKVGADALGVSFDPVNLLVRLENPMEAARRLASHIAQVHIDDAILKFEGSSALRRHLAPAGEGAIDWPALLTLLPSAQLLIELHRGQFAVPAFDRYWLSRNGYVTVHDLAWFVERATEHRDSTPINQDDVGLRIEKALGLARAR